MMKILNLCFPMSCIVTFLVLLGLNFQCGESSSSFDSESMAPFCNKATDFTTTNFSTVLFRDSRSLKKPSPTKLFDNLLSQRVFNTTMNFIVPGAKVTLPHSSQEGSLVHLAMQAFFGLFWAIAWISTIAFPWALTIFKPFGLRRSFDAHDDFKLKWKLNEKVTEAIGLNWTSCMQKTICQAHQPTREDRYGVIGKIIRVLFPTYADSPVYLLSPALTQFEESAQRGAIGQNCNHIYKCFFDVLDLILYVKDLLLGKISTLN